MQVPLTKILQRIESLGGDARPLIFEDTAVYDYVYEIELQLTYKIPDDFKKVLLTLCSHCEFKWFLPGELTLPYELKKIFGGELHNRTPGLAKKRALQRGL